MKPSTVKSFVLLSPAMHCAVAYIGQITFTNMRSFWAFKNYLIEEGNTKGNTNGLRTVRSRENTEQCPANLLRTNALRTLASAKKSPGVQGLNLGGFCQLQSRGYVAAALVSTTPFWA